MKKLTSKEEEIMELFWEKGPLFVKDCPRLGRERLHRTQSIREHIPILCHSEPG